MDPNLNKVRERPGGLLSVSLDNDGVSIRRAAPLRRRRAGGVATSGFPVTLRPPTVLASVILRRRERPGTRPAIRLPSDGCRGQCLAPAAAGKTKLPPSGAQRTVTAWWRYDEPRLYAWFIKPSDGISRGWRLGYRSVEFEIPMSPKAVTNGATRFPGSEPASLGVKFGR